MSSGESTLSGAPTSLLVDHLLGTNPCSIFLIGCSSTDLYWPEGRESITTFKRFETLNSAELSIKSEGSENLTAPIAVLNIDSDVTTLPRLIGRAVRAFPHRLLVYTNDKTIPDTLFFSFGFRKLKVVQSASGDSENRWYEFRLSHYKQSPDWLNARFWANPQRFDVNDDGDIDFDPDDTDEEE